MTIETAGPIEIWARNRWNYGGVVGFDKELFDFARVHDTYDREQNAIQTDLLAALKKASDWICGEACSDKHTAFCKGLVDIINKAEER